MTSSPDLIHELRASRPSAPARAASTRARDRGRAAAARSPWASWRFPVRRGVLVAVPAAAALAFATRRSVGLARSDAPSTEALRQSGSREDDARAATEAGEAALAPSQGRRGRSATGDRAQRVSATLTVEVSDSDAVSRAAQDALDLTRSLGGYVVSSSVATGEEGSASITVRVPVAKVQDAITGPLGARSHRLAAGDDRRPAATLDELERREATVREPDRADPGAPRDRDARRPDGSGAPRQAADAPQRADRAPHRHLLDRGRSAHVDDPAHGRDARSVRRRRTARRASTAAIDEALNVLAWEGVIALGMLIVLAPFALVAFAAWLGRRLYRRHEEERLLAT